MPGEITLTEALIGGFILGGIAVLSGVGVGIWSQELSNRRLTEILDVLRKEEK